MLSEKLNMWGGGNKTRGEFSFKCCREWIHFSLTSADSPDCSLIHEHFKLKWACRLSVGRLTLSFGKINSQMFSSGETSSVAIGHVKLSPVKFSVTCEQFNTEINLNSGLKISKCIKKKKKKRFTNVCDDLGVICGIRNHFPIRKQKPTSLINCSLWIWSCQNESHMTSPCMFLIKIPFSTLKFPINVPKRWTSNFPTITKK